jgi:2-polyprenyl-3-methyl-5-hydroxy-6-metoxy-1,4-benzoquinol methylase
VNRPEVSRPEVSRPEGSRPAVSVDPQSFDHLAARYDRLATLLQPELHAWLLFHLPARGDRALDLGCGSGVHTDLLAQRYDEVLAVDLSEPMLELARRSRPHPNVRYEQRDLRDLRAGTEGRFDLVFSAYTLHHLAEVETALHRIRSLVRPGGRVLLVDLVDDRPEVPRRWLRARARRTFGADLLHRRRPVRQAVELLRLQLDPDWLDHQTTDRLRPAEDWDAHCRAVFPGAALVTLDRARALTWEA